MIAVSEFTHDYLPDNSDTANRGKAKHRRSPHEKKIAQHRPESLDHALKIAWCDWAAGMVIGLMPLLCHLLLHFAARSAPDWDDNGRPIFSSSPSAIRGWWR